MSTIAEIQKAIERLPRQEQLALSAWLASTEETGMADRDETALLASLDLAARQLDSGLGVPLDEVRNRVSRWASE